MGITGILTINSLYAAEDLDLIYVRIKLIPYMDPRSMIKATILKPG